jgi:hypothetical protein
MAIDEELASVEERDSSQVPPISVREIGYNSLSVVSGQVLEECDPNLRWPRCINTYKKMLHDGVIAPAVDIFNTTVSEVGWTVKAPKGYEQELVGQVAYLKSVMNDMNDQSWFSFIREATSFIHFGFAPFEIVLKYRTEDNSRYNDGLVGIKKLSLIGQDSVSGWEYKNKGRDLSGLWQCVNIPSGKNNNMRPLQRQTVNNTNNDNGKTEQFIPRKKFLLFRNNPLKNNPEGNSPLKAVYRSWKYRIAYEENLAHGVNIQAPLYRNIH